MYIFPMKFRVVYAKNEQENLIKICKYWKQQEGKWKYIRALCEHTQVRWWKIKRKKKRYWWWLFLTWYDVNVIMAYFILNVRYAFYYFRFAWSVDFVSHFFFWCVAGPSGYSFGNVLSYFFSHHWNDFIALIWRHSISNYSSVYESA